MLTEIARKRLLDFRDSIIIPLVNTDADKWPIRSGRIGHLCLGEFSEEFVKDLQLLRQQGLSDKDIASLFNYPTRLWRMSHHLLNGLRLHSASLEAQQQTILTLLDLISYLKSSGDPYCQDGANIIWPRAQVEDVIVKLRPIEDFAVARLLHQLAGVLWAYTECLYFVAHELSVEIHGPYTIVSEQKLLVRDFFDLQPYELWPSIDALVSCRTVRIMIVYKKFHGHLDVYNNLYLDSDARLTNEAIYYEILIDDRCAEIAEIQQLIQEVSRAIKRISDEVASWSLEQIARHYIHIFWWRKEVLSRALQKDWRPPEKVLRRVQPGSIPDPSAANPSLERLRKQYDLM